MNKLKYLLIKTMSMNDVEKEESNGITQFGIRTAEGFRGAAETRCCAS
jgi:hypothetical protein